MTIVDDFTLKFRISDLHKAHVLVLHAVPVSYAQAMWDRLSIGFEMMTQRPQ